MADASESTVVEGTAEKVHELTFRNFGEMTFDEVVRERASTVPMFLEQAWLLGAQRVLIECLSPYDHADLQAVRTQASDSSLTIAADDPKAALVAGEAAAHRWLLTTLFEQPSPPSGAEIRTRNRFAQAMLPLIKRAVIAYVTSWRARVRPAFDPFGLISDLTQSAWVELLGETGIRAWRPADERRTGTSKRLTGFVRMLTERATSNALRGLMAKKRGGDALHLSYESVQIDATASSPLEGASLGDLMSFVEWIRPMTKIAQRAHCMFLSGFSNAEVERTLPLSRRQVVALRDDFDAFWRGRGVEPPGR